MNNIAIIADDLTGACDAGVKLLKQGYKTEVIIDSSKFDDFNGEDNEAISVNTESRALSAEDAYRVVYQTTLNMKKKGYSRFYKKVDSVLRGNIGSEIDAVLDALDGRLAIVASALPVNGRIIMDGKLNVITSGADASVYSIEENIRGSGKREIGNVYLETIRKGTQSIQQEILKLTKEGKEVLVFDSVSNDDLEKIAVALDTLGLTFLPVGTAGLINFLEAFWRKDEKSQAHKLSVASVLDVLLVVGTKHPTTASQVLELLSRGDVYVAAIDVEDLNETKAQKETKRLMDKLDTERGAVLKKKAILLTTYTMLGNEGNKNIEYNSNVSNALITKTITDIARKVMDSFSLNKCIVTGGDTSSSLFNDIGAQKIVLLDEPLPGIVTGSIGDNNLNLLVSTKSGGFGDSGTLVNLLDYMADIKFLQ